MQHRGQNFECDAEYSKEIQYFKGCIPKKCGRFVLDKLVTANEAEILLRLAKRGNVYLFACICHLKYIFLGISLGGSSGELPF